MTTLATPTFSPIAGFYSSPQSVLFTSTGATFFFYTTNGITPTEVGGLAGPSTTKVAAATPVSVAISETIKVLAYDGTDTDSAVASAAYHILAISAVSPTTLDELGETLQLAGGIVTGGITNVTNWSSSNTDVATVGAHTGIVTAVSKGSTTITAEADELHTLTSTAVVMVGALTVIDVNTLQTFLNDLVQSFSTSDPFQQAQQVRLALALSHLRSNTLTVNDLELMQSLLNDQYQTLNTAGPYQAGQLAAVKQALADVRSLL